MEAKKLFYDSMQEAFDSALPGGMLSVARDWNPTRVETVIFVADGSLSGLTKTYLS